MLLKYFYDKALAHASYMVGCQRSGEAIIVDPGRDVDQYIQAANAEGLKLTAVAETHIHADYVSGARELADRVGAKLYVSDAGPAEWKYLYLDEYDNQRLVDGDTFHIGNIQFEVMHTPGHTPESISFVLTDQGGGANVPMGIFTGDFVFVGSIGRPDLLEEAAGILGSAREGASQLYHSVQRFLKLPDHLQIWPAHGAGSACGKGLGAIPSSTVGYEKLFNPALQYTDEQAFVDYILSDQPEAPKYFAVMKRVNKVGPTLLKQLHSPVTLPISLLSQLDETATVIDLSASKEFAKSHVPGSINIPLPSLAAWAGWLVDYDHPVYLITGTEQTGEALRILRKIGIDQIEGLFSAVELRETRLASESYSLKPPIELLELIETKQVTVIDVRSNAEWNSGHIEGACHHFLGKLPATMNQIDRTKPVVTHCQLGARSSIAASLLQANGFEVIDMAGGFRAWEEIGFGATTSQAVGEACTSVQ